MQRCLITLLSLSLLLFMVFSRPASAVSTTHCKNEALKAAFDRYMYQFPEAIISIQLLGSPIIEKNLVYYTIQMTDIETGQKEISGVILTQESCKVVAVN